MNIKEALLDDATYSKEHILKISEYACASAKNFKTLMQCFLANDYRLAQRAAWSVSWAARKKPEMIKPHIKSLVEQLERKPQSGLFSYLNFNLQISLQVNAVIWHIEGCRESINDIFRPH